MSPTSTVCMAHPTPTRALALMLNSYPSLCTRITRAATVVGVSPPVSAAAPSAPATGGVGSAAAVGGTARSAGVMKEDGETFEEPPEVAAASMAASASASGTEAREVRAVN